MKKVKLIAGVMAAVIAGTVPCYRFKTENSSFTAKALIYSDEMKYGNILYKKTDNDDNNKYDRVIITGCDKSAVSINIPSKIDGLPVEYIEDSAFSEYDSISKVTVSEGVEYINHMAFYNCTSLTSVTLPNSIKEIHDWAFYGCTSLTNITIPDSVKVIGYSAFANCTSLKSITIPESASNMGVSILSGCSSLTNITVAEGNKNYSSSNGVLFNKDKSELIQYPMGNKRTEYVLPDSVKTIVDMAFIDCTSLKKVTIPDSVKSIKDSAFSGCSALESITISNPKCTINTNPKSAY